MTQYIKICNIDIPKEKLSSYPHKNKVLHGERDESKFSNSQSRAQNLPNSTIYIFSSEIIQNETF